MKLFIGILVTLVVAAMLTAAMQYDSGYILLAWGQTTVEMTIWVGLAVLLVFLGLVALAFILLRRGGRLRDRLGSMRSVRRRQRDRDRSHRGLVAFHAGDWAKARRLLVSAAQESDRPLNNYLLAARASHALGDKKAAGRYLNLAEATGAGADVAVALTRAELEFEGGQLKAAEATLNNLRQARNQPAVLRMLQEIYCGLKDWPKLRALLPEMRKLNALGAQRLDELERQALLGELGELQHQSDSAALDQWWQGVPARWQGDGALLLEYLGVLRQRDGGEARAVRQLLHALKSHWDSRLLDLLGRLQGDDPKKALRSAEAWLKQHSEDAALRLCLGRLCLRNQLWGKARDYFESAHRLSPSATACLELVRLHEALGEQAQASRYRDEASKLMGQGLPELPLP